MASQGHMKIEGAKELDRKLKRLDKSMAGEIRKEALDAVGEFVRQDAYNKCPVKGGTSADGHYRSEGTPGPRSGAVRESIKYEVKRDHVVVGTNHIIAPDLEFGSSRESPHPFMRRSIDDPATKKGAGDKYAEIAKRGIEGAVR